MAVEFERFCNYLYSAFVAVSYTHLDVYTRQVPSDLSFNVVAESNKIYVVYC